VPAQTPSSITFTIHGKACGDTRAKLSKGWRPGPPFATHGAIGANKLYTPTVLREWLTIEPGDWVTFSTSSSQWADGPVIEDHEAARLAHLLALGLAHVTVVRPLHLSVHEHVEALRPSTAQGVTPPEWLRRHAAHAQVGEDFWA
jgi:hypothetical protein